MKRIPIGLLSLFLFFLCFCILSYALFRVLLPWNAATAQSDVKRSATTVILDAGHGGMDGGACADGQTLEKELNLKVTLLLRDYLNCMGIQTVLTRDTDVMLDTESENGTRKMRDLRARLDLAHAYPDAIFVSIHMNHFPLSKYHGLQVYYSPNHDDSQKLASTVQGFTKSYLQPQNNRACKAADSAIFLMHRMENVGILVECGFLSNPSETELLKQEDYRRKLAFVLSCAILEYCNTNAHALT